MTIALIIVGNQNLSGALKTGNVDNSAPLIRASNSTKELSCGSFILVFGSISVQPSDGLELASY